MGVGRAYVTGQRRADSERVLKGSRLQNARTRGGVKFPIAVADNERHSIESSWNQLTGAPLISVDDVPVAKKAIAFIPPTNLKGPLDAPATEKWDAAP